MAILAVSQYTAAHATKYHSLGYGSARVSGFIFDVRNGPDEGDQVFSVNYLGSVVLGVPLPVASGGSGLSSYTIGDIVYASGTTTLSKLGIGTAAQVLVTNAGATAPEWVAESTIAVAAASVVPGVFTASSSWSFAGSTIIDLGIVTTVDINGGTVGGVTLDGTISGTPTWASTQAMNVSGSSGSTTGNAATATALQTARTIGGVSFDGTANIAVTLAATATALATARDINGVSFDGTANITVTAAAGTLTGTTLKSTVVSSSLTSLGTITSLVATTADINGGTIDGTTVGSTVKAAGAFTTLEAATNFVMSGNAANVIGSGSTQNNQFFRITGSFTSGGLTTWAAGWSYAGTLTGAPTETGWLAALYCTGNVVTQTATENIGVIAQAYFDEPNITDNLTGDITVAATVYIKGAPSEGETNAALYVNSGSVFVPTPSTVSGTGLMVTSNSAGTQEIMRDSSSARWKTDIQDAVIDVGAVLAINAKAYGRGGKDRYIGFIVEDFDAAGFGDILDYDDVGPTGFLEFGRGVTALHHAVLQSHGGRIDGIDVLQQSLGSRLTTLGSRLTTLRSRLTTLEKKVFA